MAKSDAARFDWSDPFQLDAQLNDEERMIRDSAHAFARRSSCSPA
jgi:glutaryl-CoA dehydrogenase